MKRCIKKRTNKDVPRGEEGEKEGGGGGKGAYVAVLTRNTDEDPQWFRDASQVVSLWMSNYLDTTTGNMRRSVRGKGQDYKFSSFRTPKRTEVENNPQPYPARGNSLSHWWQIGCHFQKRLKTMACAQLEQSLQSTHSCIRPHFFFPACAIIGRRDQSQWRPRRPPYPPTKSEASHWNELRASIDTWWILVTGDFFDEWVSLPLGTDSAIQQLWEDSMGVFLPCSCSIRVIAILEPWASNTTWPWDTDGRKDSLFIFYCKWLTPSFKE